MDLNNGITARFPTLHVLPNISEQSKAPHAQSKADLTQIPTLERVERKCEIYKPKQMAKT